MTSWNFSKTIDSVDWCFERSFAALSLTSSKYFPSFTSLPEIVTIFHDLFPFFEVLSQFHKSSSLTGKMALKNWVSRPLSAVLSIISVDKKLWMASRALHVLWLVEVAAPFSAATTEIQKTTTLTRNENDRHRSEISNDGNSCKKLELWIFSHYLAFMLR